MHPDLPGDSSEGRLNDLRFPVVDKNTSQILRFTFLFTAMNGARLNFPSFMKVTDENPSGKKMVTMIMPSGFHQ